MGSTTRRLRTDHGHRWAEIGTVGLLSAVLATGGTFAVVQATTGDDGPVVEEAGGVQQPLTASNASLGTADDWAAVAERVSPSVVSIGVESARGNGAGSGVVWDDQGHIVTNAHVVAGSQTVRVTLADGRGYQATVVGADPSTDLAVLQFTNGPGDLIPITVGDDEGLAVGDQVMAIGNPLGLSGTVTNGIVSALDRPVTTQSSEADPEQGSAVVTNAIQTSAAINPGNSGGALVDASGQLIGVNSSIASLSSGMGGPSGSIGIGFAIPVGGVSSVVGQLVEDGSVEHAFLGVGLQDAEADDEGANLRAAGVSQVEEGSPAGQAGMQEGDVILDIDGERVDSAVALVAQVRQRTTGDEVVIGYVRDQQRADVTVTLDARPDDR